MDMENLGTEVSAKIRSAIKAKLVELDAYVDDELPDYIMVMVANKKTETQMQEDLTLFLNEKALVFSQWLHSVLAKLQKVTFGGKPEAKKAKVTKKSKSGDGGKKKSKAKDKPTTEQKSEASGNENDQISEVDERFDQNINKHEQGNQLLKKSIKNETLGKDNDEKNAKHVKTSNERKTAGRSRSLSSRSFSVSKSPSPALRPGIRSPPTNRNISRSPIRHSPEGYRDYRQSSAGYQDFRRTPLDRHSFPERRHQPYDRSAPRFPPSGRGNYGRGRIYDRQGQIRIQQERRGPQPQRRTPPDYFRGHSRMRRSEEGRRTNADDYQGDRKQSPYRHEKRSKSPMHSRELSRSRSNSPTFKGISKQQKYTAEEHLSNRDNSYDRTLHRSRKSDEIRSRNKTRGRSNSFSPTPKQGVTVSSSIGAVISHESDGEYNPERLLKKSIVASKVSVTSRPGRSTKDANPKIVRRAAMDAEMDIRKKKVDARKRESELDQIRINRQRLTKARQRGELDQNKIKEINHQHSDKSKSVQYLKEARDSHIKSHANVINSDESDRDDSNEVNRDKTTLGRTLDEQLHHKSSRVVRRLKTGESIKSRKAAMDSEISGVGLKFTRLPADRSDERKRKINQMGDEGKQDESDSNALEDTLPDLRQRLVDRKQRRKQEKQEPIDDRTEQHTKHNERKRAFYSDNLERDANQMRHNDEDEHLISGELILDKNGRKVLPKHLRIQATIRNERHINSREDAKVGNECISDDRTQSNLKERKRHDRSNDIDDIADHSRGNKRRRVDKRDKGNTELGEGEEELSEMRRNAIESMRRRREAGTSQHEGLDSNMEMSKERRSNQTDKREGKKYRKHGAQKSKKDVMKRRDSEIETLKQVILEIQDGDSDEDISSVSSENEENDVSDISEEINGGNGEKNKDSAKSKEEGEESEISLSSTEDEDDAKKARIPVHTTKDNSHSVNAAVTKEGKSGAGKTDPTFIVTLEGISSAYFKKEDKEVSKGGLKLKKQDPTSQIVYIKTNRTPNIASPESSITYSKKPVINLPNSKIIDGLSQGQKSRSYEDNGFVEKPKAMVAPIRSTSSHVLYSKHAAITSSKSHLIKKSSTCIEPTTALSLKDNMTTSITENLQNDSCELPKRKRILPPQMSPTSGSPHSVLAGTNRYLKRPISETSGPSPGIMSICKFWPNCSRGDECRYYHPKGSTSGPSITTVHSATSSDKFRWTSASAQP